MGKDNVLREKVIETIENGMVNGMFIYRQGNLVFKKYPLLVGYSPKAVLDCIYEICEYGKYRITGYGGNGITDKTLFIQYD